jgi:hypothetical protein
MQIYAHHVTEPRDGTEKPEYHMTQLDAYAMSGSNATLLRGSSTFKNIRKLAREYQERLVQTANARARQLRADLLPHSDSVSTLNKLQCADTLQIAHDQVQHDRSRIMQDSPIGSCEEHQFQASWIASHPALALPNAHLAHIHVKKQRRLNMRGLRRIGTRDVSAS